MNIQAQFLVNRGIFVLDVHLDIPSRGVTAIYGPSGSGKTTLLRAMAGLDRHKGGVFKLGETTWQDRTTFVPTHRRSLGYVFQEASLFPHLSVRKNLLYGIRRIPTTDQRVSLTEAIELLGIGDLLERRPDTLSGGERQRVAIARALAVSPRLLLMDEPLASLDDDRKREFMPYLESLHTELDLPVIYVTHAPDEVARLANHIVILDAGKVTASGEISEVLTRLDGPLARRDDAVALVDVCVVAHDEEYDLTELEFSGGRFMVVRKHLPIGTKARLRISARDVSLTLTPQDGTSILNIFPAVVDQIVPDGRARMIVRLTVRDSILLARVTRKSADMLSLSKGMALYAQVKSVALA
jgi:molybdate transport system ATP-binding protein